MPLRCVEHRLGRVGRTMVVDPRGLSVCVWDQTNHLFRHATSASACARTRMGTSGLDRAVRTMRGEMTSTPHHRHRLARGCQRSCRPLRRPAHRHRSVLTSVFWDAASSKDSPGCPRLFHHARRPRAPPLVVTDADRAARLRLLRALALCLVLAACRCCRRRGRAGRDTSPPTAHARLPSRRPAARHSGARAPADAVHHLLLANDDDDDDDD